MNEQVTSAVEVNFDALVGPTHNYAGLAYGNVASLNNAGAVSHPKQAAIQGLEKMAMLMRMGVPQAVLPPQLRPNFKLLRQLGFMGTEQAMLQQAYQADPQLLAAAYSAASMWVANMATVSPAFDTVDGKVHITPANLAYSLHRAQEAEFSYVLLQRIFADLRYFIVHPPLLACSDLCDEGAANHMVLSAEYQDAGMEVFVYGRSGLGGKGILPQHFPARQTKFASSALLRQHTLIPEYCLLLQQNPAAIDAGVFHNDVVCVSNKNVMLYHEQAYSDWESHRRAIHDFFGGECSLIEIASQQLSLAEAVNTYMFNSQLVSLPGTSDMALILPIECQESNAVQAVLTAVLEAENPITQTKFVNCRESMRNGGGPACLRLRVVLSTEQYHALPKSLLLTEELYITLLSWINKHYRESLMPDDLLDPMLLTEAQVALEELTKILRLGSIYEFQVGF